MQKYDVKTRLTRARRGVPRLTMFLAAIIVNGCASTSATGPEGSEPPEVKEIWVKHHLVPCRTWQGQSYCYSVSDRQDGPWKAANISLQHFHYQWGYTYQLMVLPTELSRDVLQVIKIKRKVPVDLGTEFEFTVDSQPGLRRHVALSDGVGQILMGPAFTCSSRELCEDIESQLSDDKPFVVKFAYGVNGMRAVGLVAPSAPVEVEVVEPGVEIADATNDRIADRAAANEGGTGLTGAAGPAGAIDGAATIATDMTAATATTSAMTTIAASTELVQTATTTHTVAALVSLTATTAEGAAAPVSQTATTSLAQ